MKHEIIPIMADCRVGTAHQSRLCHSERSEESHPRHCEESAVRRTTCQSLFNLLNSKFSILHSKFLLLLCTCALVLFLIASPAHAKYGGGTGEPNDPYLIFDANQMNAIGADSNDWDRHFILMADIDLSAYTGTDFNIIGYRVSSSDNKPFTGVFDGNGHTISNFTYTSTGTDYIGLFGYVNDPNAEIKDLGLIEPDVDVVTGMYVGSLVGRVSGGTITNCYVQGGSVTGTTNVGGLVGHNGSDGTISNCYSTGDVSGDENVGGLIGVNYGRITNCYSTGSVRGDWLVGGLVGENRYGTISNCYATGSVVGDRYVGGLVGYNRRTITNSYSEVVVSGNYYVGGLVGLNSSGTITNCYSEADVSGVEDVGGLVGWNGGPITNCYSTASVTGTADVGGLVGERVSGTVSDSFWDIQTSGQTTSDGGTGKTTAEMQTASTFALVGWGCGSVWTIDEGNDYPRLFWENKPGELITIPSELYGGGSGELNDPYLIYTAEQLNTIGLFYCDWGKDFKLMADIDLAAYTGTSFNIIGTTANPFTGVFDGNGHTISNFTYTSTATNYIGLFGYVYDPNAEIKNLGLIDPDVDAGTGYYVGSLVGRLSNGTVTNCYVEGGSVTGHRYVGGLVGLNSSGTITNCYVEGGSVAGSGWRYGGVGGLVGSNGSTISNCYATGSVEGIAFVGGLIGRNGGNGTITNCYSTGSVTGNRDVGGLVGWNYSRIAHCYSTGDVSGNSRVGGLVGNNTWCGDWGNCYEGEVWASFWDIETSGQSTSASGTGKTTAEMQTASTFIGWGCDPVWTIDEGVDYPRLVWENKPGELITVPSGLYGGGSGDPNDPYLIYTAEQLNMIGLIRCHWDKHFILMADIDLSAFTGTAFNIIGTATTPFTGVFDGNGHTISNFTYTCTDTDRIGLFGYIDDPNAEIKNLGLTDAEVDAGTGYYVGLQVGYLTEGTITNCYVEGGSVSGYRYVGGLVGSLYESGIITNCYYTGSVEGDYYVGGLVGYNRGAITNCYATSSVSGRGSVGGLVGDNYNGTVTASFWDIETSGQSTSAGGTGLPTAEMQMASTFTDAGWDFVGERINGSEDIWMMTCEGMSYPKLNWWQPVLGDYFCPDGVDMIDMEHLALHWLDTGCDETNDYCDWAEISNDSTIDFTDFAILAGNWLAGL